MSCIHSLSLSLSFHLATFSGFRGAERSPLDWESRLKISLGAAKGLAHIHSAGGPRCVHGNIKSSNVLLGQDLEACVADFGLSPVITPPPHPVLSRRAMGGYRAPESLDPAARRPAQKADVYSFGVVLLEVLTGRIPIRYPGMRRRWTCRGGCGRWCARSGHRRFSTWRS